MKPDQFRQLEDFYFELERSSPEIREARLAELRADHPELAVRLERMLLLVDSETSTSLDASKLTVKPSEDLRPGDTIGPYRLTRLLGEGGMGVVFEAEQSEPVERRVALKIVKKGLDSKAILGRFENERQALARMQHPSVARVLDAGTALDGRPYFAMDLVEGLPIGEYCRRAGLDAHRRIELLISVCDAVQHAHRRGIVHRDLKPSNVLVEDSESGGPPVVKVIDFGISKAIQEGSDLQTQWTRHGQLLGTPEYMSPEQFAGEDVDTRSDVYSLGVLLFELLVGEPPLSGERVRGQGLRAMQSQVQEFETPRPSELVARSGRDFAKEQHTTSESLSRLLRRDLDWVVLKALAKDRDQRYESPTELAAELRRFLGNEPVLAGPPTLRYRASKFLRRHRLAAGLAMAVASTLIAALIGLSVGLVRAQRAEAKAQRETEVARQVLDFMKGILADGAREAGQGNLLTTAQLFERARLRLADDPPADPRVYGTILNRIGEFFQMDLEEFATAEQMFEEAAEILEQDGVEKTELATANYMLGILARMRGDLERASQLQQSAAALLVEVGGAEVESADILGEQAMLLRTQGRAQEALEILDRAAVLMLEAKGAESRETVSKYLLRSGVLSDLGREDERLGELQRLLEISERRGFWHFVSVIHNDLGALAYGRGDLAGAYRGFSEAARINEEHLGGDPQRLAGQLSNIAMIAAKRGDYSTAERQLRQSITKYEEVYGGRSPDWAATSQLLAEVLLREGRHREAEALLVEILPYEYEQESLRVGPFRGERNLAFARERTGRPELGRAGLAGALEHEDWRGRDPMGWCQVAIDRARLAATAAQASEEYRAALASCAPYLATAGVAYARLRYHASQGEIAAAVDLLTTMEPQRYVDHWPRIDPLLDPLRGEAAFQQFLEQSQPN
jgi:non-specific serine/threonine protein kinase/serine/threonine-protein kinase